MKALVIDDNKHITDSMIQMLAFFDLEGIPAYGARDGLTTLKDMTPSIVFLDLNMPGLTGFEVLSYLRREPRLTGVPVVVVTADDQPESAERAMQNGADAYVIKPITLDVLESSLKSQNLIP